MAIIGIVAIDRRGAIGKGGALPWHYSSDLKFFREQTTGHACVMGRRTWLTLQKPLKNRLNIVLTHSTEIETQDSLIVLRDKLAVLSLNDYLSCDLYIIGGAQVYESFAAEIERWIVTEVPLTVEGADTFMPPDFLQNFVASDSRQLEDDLKATFYQRRT